MSEFQGNEFVSMLSLECKQGSHDKCAADEWGIGYCTCSCHGDDPPAGVREPRNPYPSKDPLAATADL